MDLSESPLLDAASMEVLAVAYRVRPTTVTGLADLLATDIVERLDEILDALSEAGFLRRRGETLTVDSPYATFVALSQHRVASMEAETRRTVAMIEALPTLIRNWDLGEAEPGGAHPLAAWIAHGRQQRTTMWQEHFAATQPIDPSWVVPAPEMLAEIVGEGAPGRIVGGRIILRPTPTSEGRTAEALALADHRGMEVRVLEDLPGWFYVERGALASVPVMWGETTPTSILLLRTPPLVDALCLLFTQLWERAEPVVPRPAGWQPVLSLLAQGLTDGAIAQALGQDERTVRRRIAEAMAEFGANSRFALGVAWAARSESRAQRTRSG